MTDIRAHVTLDDIPELDLMEVRRRLGRKQWAAAAVGRAGANWVRYDQTRSVIVTVSADYPDNPGDVVWIHASICSHPAGASVPAYEELVQLRAAVWGERGWALQIFAPPANHVNIRGNALHLWGRADGYRSHPDFGWAGTI